MIWEKTKCFVDIQKDCSRIFEEHWMWLCSKTHVRLMTPQGIAAGILGSGGQIIVLGGVNASPNNHEE